MKVLKFNSEKEYIDFLTEASEKYYNDGESIVSDQEFDRIYDEFKAKYPKSKYLKQVGAAASNLFKKVKHSIPMGSQSKVNTAEELKDWFDKSNEKVNKNIKELFISEKVDGFSLSLTYNKDFTQAITRGDGVTGEDVSQNVIKIPSVPKKIKLSQKITIRGEAVLFKKKFEELFKDKANPRNAAAGVIRRLDGERCEHLTFLAYDILIDGKEVKSEKEKFELLKEMGFTTPKYTICKNLTEVNSLWEKYSSNLREASEYEMDGLIVCINDCSLQEVLGIIDQRPRFSRAYKFSSQLGQSTVLDIVFFAGRTGRITPVAQIEPIFLGGVTIQNLTLHNLSELKKLGVSKGCVIELKRAGDVIPKVERVVTKSATPLEIPSKCPSCGEKTVEEDKFLMCHNEDCDAKHYETLLHWVKTLEIKGFGEELVSQLNEAGLVASPVDFYKLTVETISSLDRRGEKSATKVLAELNSKRELEYPIFIKALGIINFSDKTAEMVQPHFPTLDKLSSATAEELEKIHGVGEIVAKAIVKGLKQRKKTIAGLMKYITIKPYTPPKAGGKLKDKSFCFTGVRDKNLEKKIVELGGKIASGVSKELTYLVAKDPEENSSKLVKARSLDVKILTLTEASALVNS